MGGKTTTSTNTVTIPKEVMDQYKAINAKAGTIAETPFKKYGTQASDFVAQMNEQQQKGISGLNAIAESGPSYNTVQNYLNPYLTNVADTTRKQMEQANEQAQSGALGTAAQSGAFGGDRAGVAAANLANQQNMAMGSTMANIYSQGFDQATNANMNDLNRMAGLAGNQLAMGTQMQQTEQAGKDALINQFQQEQGYPFQVASWLANIALGTGAQSGSTTTSTQPSQFWSDRRLKHDIKEIGMSHDGMPIYTFKYKGDPQSQTHVGFMADEVEKKHPDAVGLDPSGYKTVNYDKATESMGGGVSPHHRGEAFAAGGIAGPYGSAVGSQPGSSGYVPEGYLPIGQMMIADPNLMSQHQQSMADMLSAAANAGKDLSQLNEYFGKDGKFYKQFKAYGGGVAGGYADGGLAPIISQGVTPQKHAGYLDSILAKQEEDKKPPVTPQTAGGSGQQQSGLSNVASTLGSIATIASLFSDRRLKHDIKEIGKTHNGLPIYTFKYKGDDAQQTHVGFMADEVEKKHPEAVGESHGYKTVDYSQAHKFASGGVAGSRNGYDEGGTPKPATSNPEWVRQFFNSVPGTFASAAGYSGAGGAGLAAADAAAIAARERRLAAVPDDPYNDKILRALKASGPEIPNSQVGDALRASSDEDDRFANNSFRKEAKTPAPQSNQTWPEYLASFNLGPRAAAASAMLVGDLASMGAKGLGLGAGLVGAPDTGNALMKFGDTAYENAGDAETAAFGSDREISDMYKRLAGVQRSATPISDFRGPSPGDIAKHEARVAEILARLQAPAKAAVGAKTNNTAATQTPLSLADVAGPRLDQSGAVNLGLPPSAMIERPGDYQAEAMKQSLIPRPRMRPADLGTAPSPEVAATGVVAPAGVVAQPAAGRKIASVIGGGNGFTDVMYDDGTKERKQGDLNFRNNNPGNMEYGDLAKSYGAVGTDGRFAVFPDYETGRKAQEALLFESGVYNGMDIGKAISKYAPKGDGTNDPERYAANVAAALGVPVNTPLSDLTPRQRSAMLTAMEKQEGGSGGPSTYSTTPIGADGNLIPAQGGLGADGMVSTLSNAPEGGVKPYDERNWLGKVMHNPDGSMNKDAMLSLFAGIGDMLSNPSPFLLPTIGAGVSGAANTYMARQGQLANIAQTQAETNRTNILAASERFFTVGPNGAPLVTLQGGGTATLSEYLSNPNLRASGNPEVEAQIREAAKQKAIGESGTVFETPQVQGALEKERTGSMMNNYAGAQEETAKMLQSYGSSSEIARSSIPSLLNQIEATSNMDSSGIFQSYQTEAIRVANEILQAAGQEPISSAADPEIMRKSAVLRALDMSSGSGQSAAEALNIALEAQPNPSLQPEANAKIMTSLMMANQRAIDMNGFIREYQNLQGNDNHTTTQAPTAFGDTYGRQYIAEEKALQNIVLDGAKPINADGDTMVSILSGTDLNSQQKNNIIAAFLTTHGMSEDEIANLGNVSRYFGG